MDDQEPAAAKPRSRTRLDGQAVLSLVPVVAIFYYLLRGIDLGQVWAEIRRLGDARATIGFYGLRSPLGSLRRPRPCGAAPSGALVGEGGLAAGQQLRHTPGSRDRHIVVRCAVPQPGRHVDLGQLEAPRPAGHRQVRADPGAALAERLGGVVNKPGPLLRVGGLKGAQTRSCSLSVLVEQAASRSRRCTVLRSSSPRVVSRAGGSGASSPSARWGRCWL